MKEEIRQLITRGKLDEALNKMLPYTDDAIVLKSQLATAKRESTLGLVGHSENMMTINRLTYATLSLLDEITESKTTVTVNQSPASNANQESVRVGVSIPKVFFSYSHDDKKHLDDLLTYLKPLQRANKIEVWTDSQILPGQEWNKSIIDNLHNADIVIMLVSAEFLASSYIWEKELTIAIDNRDKGKTTVIPVILKRCLWDQTILKSYQAIPQDDNAKLKPVTQWEDRNDAWYNVAQGIIKVVDNMKI